jgi:thiol-disulfide isomerase/thioredoxin
MKSFLATAAVALTLSSAHSVLAADVSAGTLTGRWDAALVDNGPPVAFRLDISGSDDKLAGIFYDGFHPYDATTSGTFRDGKLLLKAEHYLTTITAHVQNGELVGDTQLTGPGYTIQYGFHAVRHVEAPSAASASAAPNISGSWEIPLDSPSSKGEKAFRLIVEQHGAQVAASILRVDGDTGSYSGSFKDGKWVLSHFDGHRPGVIEISTRGDGALDVLAHNEAYAKAFKTDSGSKKAKDDGDYGESPLGPAIQRYVAYRSQVARAKGLPQPDDYLAHTTARDPHEKFSFKFPDADGHVVSSEDSRFRGKVVLAIVTGTWCPNCHDEAQYLVQLDRKYRDKGLRIVALDFEEPEQQGTLERERAFVKQYGVKYPYLIAGAPSQMWEKVPQLVNLNTWPATVFVGRDGTVRAVHSGFASPASGEFNTQLKEEFEGKIQALLAEKASTPAKTASTVTTCAAVLQVQVAKAD